MQETRKPNAARPPGGYDFDRAGAAAYLSSAPATLTWWAARGTGPAYAIAGGKAWYKKSDLDAFLARRVRLPVIEEDARDGRNVARTRP